MTLLVRSELLDRHGFVHGFSLRTGGVSEGPFASLNLARTVGDDPEAVAENTRRYAEALGDPPIYEVSQVHGREVVEVNAGDTVSDVRAIEADALVTRAPGVALAVRTADCVPILLADPASGAVAAVHAGWRGVAARILEPALARLGGSPVAAIGPHIRLASFEVGPEVATEIEAVAHGEPVTQRREPRPHVDLARAVSAQLRALGVETIDDVGGDTFAEPERFFSHRRDQGRTGRHLSAIVSR